MGKSKENIVLFYTLIGLGAVGILLGGCSRSVVNEKTLSNGLRVIVKEDHRSPVVVSQVWYRVGSMDEPEGLTGISHVLEHMMFKGTKRLKPNEFSRIIAENGGRENAFTSYDYTAYFQQLEKSRLHISFDLEAERMQNLELKDEEFRKEIRVVMEERRLRTDDKPQSLLYEKFSKTAYRTHPYKHPIIGWMEDLERLRVEDLRDWYGRFYSPSNATVVVVGDVQPREVFALAEKYFGSVPARPVNRVKAPAEPAQDGLRETRLALPAEVPYFIMGFHVPVYSSGESSWEPYALNVLAGVLDGGNSARFPRELIRQKRIASNIDVSYSPIARDPTLILFDATPAAGYTVEDVQRALLEQIERLKEEPISDSELKRVKAQVVAQDVYARDSVFYQAMQIGQLETTERSWRLIDERIDRFNDVTAEQVQRVARKYLTHTNLTVAVLDPLPIETDGKRPRANAGEAHAR
jgi:zinc protease